MRVFALLPALLCTAPVMADCAEEITGFYAEGGLFDPAELTPQEHKAVWVSPDGTETPMNTSRWESATRSISDNNGNFLLSYDRYFYSGPGWDGPWTDMNYPENPDPIEFGRMMNASVTSNLADMECHAEVDLSGTSALKYSYRYSYHAPDDSSWWESDYVLYVDAKTGHRLRTEEYNLIESWAPDPKDTVRVTTVTMMPGYTIPNPPVAK